MQKNISFSYRDFVKRALAGGTVIATTLEQAKIIASEAQAPQVIKLLTQFDGEKRPAFLAFATEAEARDIWVICGEAKFLES